MRNLHLIFVFSLFMSFPQIGESSIQNDNGKTGTVANPFLESNPGVRAAALGGDQVTLSGHLEDIFSNPASLASLSIPELWISHNRSFIETNKNNIGLALPLKSHAWALTAHHVNQGDEDRTSIDANGNPIRGLGDFRFSTTFGQLSLAKKFASKFSLGTTGKYWSDKMDDRTKTGLAIDVGLLIHNILPWIDLGVATQNLGSKQDGYDLPTHTTAGTAIHFPIPTRNLKKLSIFSELDFSSHRDTIIRSGVEIKHRYFSLRSGYENSSDKLNDSLGDFSFGGGMRLKGWQVDYAWVPKGNLGDQHRIALSIGFGLSTEEKLDLAKKMDEAMEERIKNRANQYLMAAKLARNQGKWKLAEDELSRAAMWDPNNLDIAMELKFVQGQSKFQEANEHYHKAEKLAAKKQWLDTAAALTRTLELVPSHVEAKKLLKKARWKIKNNKRKARRKKNKTDIQFNKGVKYYLNENYDEALKVWKVVESKSPNYPVLREYMEKAEKNMALTQLKQLKMEKELNKESVETLSKKAYTLFSLNQVDKAIATWEQVLDIDPKNKDAWEALQEAKTKQNLVSENNENQNRREIYELNGQAMSAYIKGELRPAINYWRQALKIDPRNTRIQNNLKRVEAELSGKVTQP